MKLYVYDHCPFCVKGRASFGLTHAPFELVILLNDDEATPIRMIGKKMAPILEQEGRFIADSMNIVAHVDGLAGGKILAGPRNPQVAQWIADVAAALTPLTLPRWAVSPMEEFSTPAARAYFTRNKEAMIGSFKDRMADSAGYIATLNHQLSALEN